MLVVTGGAGFIGSALVWALNERGQDDILIVDDLGHAGKWKNLRGRRFIDLCTPTAAPDEWQTQHGKKHGKIDAVLHMGAITDTSETDADALYLQNTRCTHQLAKWCMENGTRFVYASSASVYGDGALGFSDNDALTPQLLPLNPYAFSKWLTDTEAIRENWTEHVAGLRFFNVFGPNEYHKGRMASVIFHAANQVRETGQMQLFQSHKEGYADGEQRRDFVSVKDICALVLWFLDNPAANGIFNAGTGQARTFNALAAAIFRALKLPPRIDYVPTPESIKDSYQYFTEADLTKLRAAGYTRPFTPLEDAVDDYVGRFLQNAAPSYL